ncbi:MAG TPA: lysozyme [Candidatus Acidoferrales bacterium]|nr:lysozyme [Candidatus Acidoferrales bacterium]
MEYSQTGLQLTEQFEGCKLTSYQDSGGVWTIGYGHTRGVHAAMTCTQEQAEQWLKEDIALAVQHVNLCLTHEVPQGLFDALVDFAFNCGPGNLDASRLLKLVNAGAYKTALEELPKWDHCAGKVLDGLLRRRLAEKAEAEASLA